MIRPVGRAAFGLACLSVAVAAGVAAAGAAGPARVGVIAVPGRTSLVFPAAVTIARTTVQDDDRMVLVSGTSGERCAPARLTSVDSRSAIAAVTVTCGADGRFDAAIVARGQVMASVRRSTGHVYVDLTVRAGAAAPQDGDGRPRGTPSAWERPREAATSERETLYARAAKLAAGGNVRGLSTLIGSLASAEREDEEVAERLEALMNVARQRRLELDRALFAEGTKR
jgi:hypothetical protein